MTHNSPAEGSPLVNGRPVPAVAVE
jgi:hypothetical protein